MCLAFIRNLLAAFSLIAFMCTNSHAVTIIDNTGATTTSAAASFGSPNTSTYGQTLLNLSGTDTVLDSFTMFLTGRTGSGSLDLRGYVAEWDGAKASNILYESTTRTMDTDGNSQDFVFDTNSLQLTLANDYVFFISTSDLPSQPSNTFNMQLDTDGALINGDFVFQNNGLSFGQLTTNDWSSISGRDAFFRAQFSSVSAVPVPAALPLFGTGLAIMGFIGWRRKRKLA